MISSSGTGIDMPLDEVETNDVVAMQSFTSYTIVPQGPTITTTTLTTGFDSHTNNGDWDGPYSFTVPTGEIGRLVYICDYYCYEGGGAVVDSSGTVYDFGRNDNRNLGYQTIIGQQCDYGDFSSGTYYSDSWSPYVYNYYGSYYYYGCNTVGTLPAGTYDFYHYDSYGDGSDATVQVQTVAAQSFGSNPTGPYEGNIFNAKSGGWNAESFVIDLNTVAEPLGANSGFGGVALGTGAENLTWSVLLLLVM